MTESTAAIAGKVASRLEPNLFSCEFEPMNAQRLDSLESLCFAVIGGGVAGLSAAWELRRQLGSKASIAVLEAQGRVGGKLKTIDFETGPVDVGAEAFLTFRQDFVDLVESVGLKDSLISSSGVPSGMWGKSGVVDMPRRTFMGIPARGIDVVGIVGKRAASRIDEERSGRPMTWGIGQDTSVGQLVEARYGREIVDQVVSPILGGVYSCHADELGVRAALPRLAEALDEAGQAGPFFLSDVVESLLPPLPTGAAGETPVGSAPAEDADAAKPSIFQALVGGYGSLNQALLQHSEAEVFYHTTVESISATNRGWYIDPIGDFDAIIIATPAPVASVLLRHAAPAAADVLRKVDLASSVNVVLRFASDIGIPERSGILMGEHGPTDAKAFTFSSRKWPHLAERGGAIVRASYGSLAQPWYLEADDRALISFAREDLAKVTGVKDQPVEAFVQRWWGGLPCYGVGYFDRMDAAYQEIARTRGIALAGAMLNGVGVPAVAASGVAAARQVIAEMLES